MEAPMTLETTSWALHRRTDLSLETRVNPPAFSTPCSLPASIAIALKQIFTADTLLPLGDQSLVRR